MSANLKIIEIIQVYSLALVFTFFSSREQQYYVILKYKKSEIKKTHHQSLEFIPSYEFTAKQHM